MMQKQIGIIALLMSSILLTACAKKDTQTATEQEASSPVTETTTAEQQAAIDALDKPVLDEKNQDVPAEVANAPADAATSENATSEPIS